MSNPVGIATSVVTLPLLDGLAAVTDERLLELEAEVTNARRTVDAAKVAIVAELVRRSDPALGHAGLAARLGASTPEKAIQALGGVSRGEARELATVAAAVDSSWMTPVDSGLTDGTLSVSSAAAIASGLGTPNADVAADDLLDAAHELVELAATSSPETLAKSARNLRERLDVASIADLEEHRRSRRTLTWHQLPDGMTRLSGLLDPESAAIVTGAIDTVLSPRRGGPRFVDAEELAAAEHLAADPRSTPQLALDTLVEIVQLATRAANSDLDPKRLFGARSPAVRVHVDLETLERRHGAAWIEGQGATVSVTTAEKLMCSSGIIPILFNGAQAIDVGRSQRLHSAAQRAGLAAQWGGCPWPNCDRPPAMTEAHHIESWNGNNTTLSNGIPLCRFHHHELHANHWQIERRLRDGEREHWLIPPPDAPPNLTPVLLRSKAPRSVVPSAVHAA